MDKGKKCSDCKLPKQSVNNVSGKNKLATKGK